MNRYGYLLFDGTVLDLPAITDIGPIIWNDDTARPGTSGAFLVTEHGRRTRELSFGVSGLVGTFRFMTAVREFTEQGVEGCPARMAYASLASEARRMLEIHHSDLVAAWQVRPQISRAA
ncbi:hypothetical protein G6L37_06135 [Agrobacterium rubi]|nr:hypothetical protein [Agrobacterium rubi]NTF24940.1 hypothetical protein [Agrobacterium rubi]